MTVIEIAVQDVSGARIALEEGADRVELCTALGATGGLTPSLATIESVVSVGIPTHVLIRSRPGSFVYTPDDIKVMARDIHVALAAGARGVVIGALHTDNTMNVAALEVWMQAVHEAGKHLTVRPEVTFHRAFDVVAEPVSALQQLADLGVDRVLTSGGAPHVGEGLAALDRLVHMGTRVQIQAGGGVTPHIIPSLKTVGVHGIHVSAKEIVADSGLTGPGGGAPGGLEVTSRERVREIVRLVRS
ncbi:copper homeostasis protein CutC [Timonella sp. A28]|uniref:copper homeostasis protein CutC n=1 Tax=Timonella sp. A28 TaxID=3442640 RepID=UPI003EBFEC61